MLKKNSKSLLSFNLLLSLASITQKNLILVSFYKKNSKIIVIESNRKFIDSSALLQF